MNYTLGDVCYWEIYIEPTDFTSKHSYVDGKLSEVYINVALDVLPSNIQVYAL